GEVGAAVEGVQAATGAGGTASESGAIIEHNKCRWTPTYDTLMMRKLPTPQPHPWPLRRWWTYAAGTICITARFSRQVDRLPTPRPQTQPIHEQQAPKPRSPRTPGLLLGLLRFGAPFILV